MESSGEISRGTASRWAAHTPSMKKLPEKKAEGAKAPASPSPAAPEVPNTPSGLKHPSPMISGGLGALLPLLLTAGAGAGVGAMSNRGAGRAMGRGALGASGMVGGGLLGGALGSSLGGSLSDSLGGGDDTASLLRMLGGGAGMLGGGALGLQAKNLMKSQRQKDEEAYGKASSVKMSSARREIVSLLVKLSAIAEGHRQAYPWVKGASAVALLSPFGLRLLKTAAHVAQGQPLVLAFQKACPKLSGKVSEKLAKEVIHLASGLRRQQKQASLRRALSLLPRK